MLVTSVIVVELGAVKGTAVSCTFLLRAAGWSPRQCLLGGFVCLSPTSRGPLIFISRGSCYKSLQTRRLETGIHPSQSWRPDV